MQMLAPLLTWRKIFTQFKTKLLSLGIFFYKCKENKTNDIGISYSFWSRLEGIPVINRRVLIMVVSG